MEEKWIPIKGFEDTHEVSNFGIVRSLDRKIFQRTKLGKLSSRIEKGKILKPFKTRMGFLRVWITKKYRVMIHDLVAQAFLPNPNNFSFVEHKDGNRGNNSTDNLKWVEYTTSKYNSFGEKSSHYRGEVLVFNKAGEIIDTLKGHRDILEKGYTSSGVSSVLLGRLKTHKKCTFMLKKDYLEN